MSNIRLFRLVLTAGSKTGLYLVLTGYGLAIAFIVGMACLVKSRQYRTEWSGNKTKAKMFYYRGPRLYLSRTSYLEAKKAEAVGLLTIARRKETKISLPHAEVSNDFFFFFAPGDHDLPFDCSCLVSNCASLR
jgi:hypothetical protein